MEIIVGIVGVIVAIAAIVVTVLVARRYRDRRELSYETSITPSLLSVDRQVRGSIEVRYEGRPVENLAGATVTLRNTGNRAVELPRKTEYEKPVTLDFGLGAEIIGEPRITEKPDNLDPVVNFESGKVVLEPMLLNPGESVSIFTLLEDFKGKVDVDARIRDVSLKKVESDEVSFRIRLLRSGVSATSAMVVTVPVVTITSYIVYELSRGVVDYIGESPITLLILTTGFLLFFLAYTFFNRNS